MKMEVQIVSIENIKPSSPTPQNLKIFKLSLLDQLIPGPYAPMVLFYSKNDLMTNNVDHQTHKRLAVLKKSLSDTLTRFYPLAGKIKDDLSIECNDEGAYYVEARVNCCLDEFLNKPDIVLLVNKFLPCEPILKESNVGTYVTNIQVNVFECGGIAIGLCISHKILDGAAQSTFLKAWTTTARGGGVINPNFIANSLFPTNDLWLRDSMMVFWGSLFKMGKCVTRRFVFDASAIEALKAHIVKSPTRVETISAFIWKSAMATFRTKHGSERPSLMTHLVNLRTRMATATFSSTEHSTGNLLWLAAAYNEPQNYKETELHELVGKVRDAISEFDSDFVKELIRSEEGDKNMILSESLRKFGEMGCREGVDYLGFTSWCRLGFYEMDFGWGKPIWVSSMSMSGGSLVLNLVVLVETRVGDGIEAWMTLDEQDMAILESDPEFLRFASVDPSPLAIGRDCLIEKVYNAEGCAMRPMHTIAPEVFPL